MYLKRARDAAGLNQETLADAMGISISQLSRYENDEKCPKVIEIEAAAKFLKRPFLSLIGPYEEQPTPDRQPDDDGGMGRAFRIVLESLLQNSGVSEERIRQFFSSVFVAYKTPEVLSPSIPSDQQIRFLTMSLAREFEIQSQLEIQRKS